VQIVLSFIQWSSLARRAEKRLAGWFWSLKVYVYAHGLLLALLLSANKACKAQMVGNCKNHL
jgi:hypothetical protein